MDANYYPFFSNKMELSLLFFDGIYITNIIPIIQASFLEAFANISPELKLLRFCDYWRKE